jgi:hypothetical protein
MRKIRYDEWDDRITEIYNCKDGMLHGECRSFREDGSIWRHVWYEHGEVIEDFILNPLRKSKYNLEEESD